MLQSVVQWLARHELHDLQAKVVTLGDSLTAAQAHVIRLQADRDELRDQLAQIDRHIQQSSDAIVAGYEQREQDNNMRLARMDRTIRDQRRLLQVALGGLESSQRGGSVEEPLSAVLSYLDQRTTPIACELGSDATHQLLSALPHELPSTAKQRASLWLRLALSYATALITSNQSAKDLVARKIDAARAAISDYGLPVQFDQAIAGVIISEHEPTFQESTEV